MASCLKVTSSRLDALKRFMIENKRSYLPPASQKVIPDEILKMPSRSIDTFTVKRVPSDAPEKLVSKITDFYKKYFLEEAPWPNALGLHYRYKTSKTVNDFLNTEFDFHIRSGISYVIENENGDIVAGNTSVCWERDMSYEGIEDASFLDWLNIAADIAHEVDDSETALVWRYYLFLAQYNYLQVQMRKHDCKFGMWNTHLFVGPEARNNLKIFLLLVNPMQQIITSHGGIIAGGTSHKHVTKRYLQTVPNNKTEHTVPYSDLKLILDGKRAFAPHEHLGEMHFSVGGARKDI